MRLLKEQLEEKPCAEEQFINCISINKNTAANAAHQQSMNVTFNFQMTLQELKAKHEQLKKLDRSSGLFKSPTYHIFGSETHKYKFNPPLGESEILVFESKHKIRLPPDYRGFLKEIGNGGSGPAYGLFPLSKWNFELEITGKDYLSGDFPYTEKWNRLQDFENEVEDMAIAKNFRNGKKRIILINIPREASEFATTDAPSIICWL
jgi:hypothetical protein